MAGLDPTLFAYATFVIFVSSLVKGIFGFGDALLAMPLLLLAVGPALATPTVALTGLVVSLVITWQTWEEIAWRTAGRLVVFAILGVPLGVLTLRYLPADLIRAGLGVLLIAYGGWALLRPQPTRPLNERWALPFGLVSGWLGGAVTTPGPPVVVYAALRRWDPPRVRGTLQAFFLPVTLAMVTGHAVGGLWTRTVGWLVLVSAIPVVLATLLGEALSHRINAERFRRLLLTVLMALGVLLLFH